MNSKRKLLKTLRFYLIVNISPRHIVSLVKLRHILKQDVDIVQLRGKGISDRSFLSYAQALRKLCKSCGIIFIVNDRADIAIACGADGVHVGQDDISPSLAKRILGKDKIIGLSTHNRKQIDKACSSVAVDYIGIGPIFHTDAKSDTKPVGVRLIKYINHRKGKLPFFAIGGITTKNIGPLAKAGAKAIAVSSAVFSSPNPETTINLLRNKLDDTA